MEFKIIVRETEDWANIDFEQWLSKYYEKFSDNDKVTLSRNKRDERKIEQFLNNVIEWNAKCRPNYFEYRHSMNLIARKTWEATGIEIMSIHDWNDFENEDIILLPTDDDDWFHPNIAQHLSKFFEDKKISRVMWKGWTWGDDGSFFVKSEKKKRRTTTSNGCAYRASRSNYYSLAEHGWGKSFWKPGVDVSVEECLSLYIRYWGSFTSLSKSPFSKMYKKPETPVPKELEWCKDSIEQARRASNLLYI